MTKEPLIRTHDGCNFGGYLARPDSTKSAPGIVVIQEIFGVNAVMRGICDNLAKAGYNALCPDLFWRQQPGIQLTDKSEGEWQRAFELYKGFNVDLGVEDLRSTLAFLRNEVCEGKKVGTIGYCLGGKLAYLMSARSDAACNVSYYGVGIQDLLDEAGNISSPLLMHIAEKDKFVPLAAQQQILAALSGNDNVEAHVYPGVDHAFARVGGEHYNKEAAHLANTRTADFLSHNLTGSR